VVAVGANGLSQTVGENLTGLDAIKPGQACRKRNHFGKKRSQILGDYDRTGDNAQYPTWYR